MPFVKYDAVEGVKGAIKDGRITIEDVVAFDKEYEEAKNKKGVFTIKGVLVNND